MSIFSGLSGITKDIGDAFANVSPILQSTGVIKSNNTQVQQPTTQNAPIYVASSMGNTATWIMVGGGVILLILVVLIASKK
jgi:hypothetical protein